MVTSRIVDAAASRSLGPWIRSERVNWNERVVAVMTVVLFPVAVALFAAGVQALDHTSGFWRCVVYALLLVVGGSAIGVGGITLGATVIALFRGRFMVHLFAGGVVLERTRGDAVPVLFSEVTAVLKTCPGVVLLMMTYRDGTVWPLNAGDTGDHPRTADFLREVASRCGASEEKTTLEESLELTTEHEWTGHKDSPEQPTTRIRDAARDSSLGTWAFSLRLNNDYEDDLDLSGIVLFLLFGVTGLVVTVPVAVMVGGPWPLIPAAVGLAFLLGAYLVSGNLRRSLRVGCVVVHVFSDGLVMERTRAWCRAVPYTDVRAARLLSFLKPAGENDGHPSHLLELRLIDGTVWAGSLRDGVRTPALVDLARWCGTDYDLPLGYPEARTMLTEGRP